MVSGKDYGIVEMTGKWLHAVCGKGIRSTGNSGQCRGCGRLVHKWCSDEKVSLSTIGDAFVCKVCQTAGDGKDIKLWKAWIWEVVCV